MPHSIQRAVALLLLIFLAPLLAAISVLVFVTMGRPVIYSGRRIGQSKEAFNQHKFRSMVNNADALLEADGSVSGPRVTPVGAFLRKTSLDELPQLLNIVRGEMVFIGPRPLLPEVADKIPTHVRYSALPGLTGLAQISGRNMLPWSQRLVLDGEYVENRSLALDTKIALLTIRQLAKTSEVAADRNPGQVMDL